MLTGRLIHGRAGGWLPLIAAALALTGSGATWPRDLELIEGAHELVLTDLALPQDAAGHVSFAPCESCTRVSLSLSAQTVYFMDGQQYDFARFAEAVTRLRAAGATRASFVGLYFENGTSRVTRIEVIAR